MQFSKLNIAQVRVRVADRDYKVLPYIYTFDYPIDKNIGFCLWMCQVMQVEKALEATKQYTLKLLRNPQTLKSL